MKKWKSAFKLIYIFPAVYAGTFIYSLIDIGLANETMTYTSDEGNEVEYTIPTNLKEAFAQLDQDLDSKTKEKLVFYNSPHDKNYTDDQEYERMGYIVYGHMGIGMFVRNQWGLWEDSKLYKWVFWHGSGGHPDNASWWILQNYVKYLKGQPTSNLWISRALFLLYLSLLICIPIGILKSLFWGVSFIRKTHHTTKRVT